MNILDVEDMIKGLPDQRLQQEAEAPTGQVPQFLVISEIQRRTDMRKRFADQQQQAPQGTVKDQVLQQGIASVAPPPQPMQAAMGAAPMQAQPMPQQMYGGGVVRMQGGGLTREELGALYDYERPMVSTRRGYRPAPGSLSQEEMILSVLGPDYEGFMPPRLPGPAARDRFIDEAFTFQNTSSEGGAPGTMTQDAGVAKRLEDTPTAQLTDAARLNEAPEDAQGGQTQVDRDVVIPVLNQKTSQTKVDEDQNKSDPNKPDPNETPLSVYDKAIADYGDLDGSVIDAGSATRDVLRLAEAAGLHSSYANENLADATTSLESLTSTFAPSYMQYMPEYKDLIEAAERRAGLADERGRKEAAAQALIQLGAGIAGGNLAGGISKAGETAADIRREARTEASAERQLAERMNMAEQEARMNLGIKSEAARQQSIEKQNDRALAAFESDRRAELERLGLDDANLRARLGLEMEAAKLGVATQESDRKFALERIAGIVAAERYGDLALADQTGLVRAQLSAFSTTIERAMEEFLSNNPRATAIEIADHAKKLSDALGIQGLDNLKAQRNAGSGTGSTGGVKDPQQDASTATDLSAIRDLNPAELPEELLRSR